MYGLEYSVWSINLGFRTKLKEILNFKVKFKICSLTLKILDLVSRLVIWGIDFIHRF